MDATFISIHDLSQDARILYVSSSITEILGFSPEEVVGRSCWDYFHPDELPFARAAHGRGVSLDRAAVLHYCRIKSKTGRWIGCECVFTVVYNVMVGCTSVYHMNPRSQRRAKDAPIIRQLFSSSPRDPRYHMLSYISSKFSQGPRPHLHEPRAALFLNRFTRSLTVMYATDGLSNLLGITVRELVGKSFYFCIAESCLPEAVRCLEGAKLNDSIAYLRFWYRDPRQDDLMQDQNMSDDHSSDQDSEGGGVKLNLSMDSEMNDTAAPQSHLSPRHRLQELQSGNEGGVSFVPSSGTSSAALTDTENNYSDRVFDRRLATTQSPASSMSVERSRSRTSSDDGAMSAQLLEVEAVVSCTSDGLVVILREARPFIFDSLRSPAMIHEPEYTNGYFASPWGSDPLLPTQGAAAPTTETPAPVATAAPQPKSEAIMQTIREVAVFAWALTGINGSLAQYARGTPAAGSQPTDGLPVWQPDAELMQRNMKMEMEDKMQE